MTRSGLYWSTRLRTIPIPSSVSSLIEEYTDALSTLVRAEVPKLSKRPVTTAFPRRSKAVILEEWEVREARKY